MDELYSVENAQKFNWSSVSGDLNSERVSHLETYLVGKKILDAGCGGGAYVEFLSRQGLDVTGIDKHEQFLQLAREQDRMGTYVQGDITNLPFPDNTFDCTYCFDVLEHIDDQRAIRELTRVTRSRLIITVPQEDEVMKRYNLTFLHYQDKTHLRNYSNESLNKLFLNNNLSKFMIFSELAIPLESLARETIKFDVENIAKKLTYSIISEKRILKLFNFRNSLGQFIYKQICNFLFRNLFDEASYQEIYTGLVAVVDLKY